MYPLAIFSSPADQGGPLPYAKTLLLNRNCLVESLTAVNKGASTCYVQLFNTPRKLAVAITNTNNSTGVITAAAHEYVTGDKVTLAGITGLTTGYMNAATADTLKLYSTRALALAGGTPDLLPTNNGESGTFSLASDAASAPVAEEYPLLAAGSAPSNVLSYSNARFTRGLYVRAVTAQNGSTLISADDIKYTPRYVTAPIGQPLTYED